MDIMERVQKRATMIEGLEPQSYKERPEGWACAAQRGEGWGELIDMHKFLKCWYKEHSIRPFSVMPRERTRDSTKWNTGGSVWTSGSTFLLCWWPSTDTGCPEWLWSFHPWRYSKVVWKWAREIGSRWSCLKETSRCPFQPQPLCDSDTFICSSVIQHRISKHHLHTWRLTSHQKIFSEEQKTEFF